MRVFAFKKTPCPPCLRGAPSCRGTRGGDTFGERITSRHEALDETPPLTPLGLQLGAPAPRRVGLLGGSFNPAHEGHRHISLEALKRLALDEVWWLVAPQNPLKPVRGMAPLTKRVAGARRLARHPRIRVLDLESRLGTRFTIDTVTVLQRILPRTRFIFLMGADNLTQIRHWKSWQGLFSRLPIAVFDRPTYCFKGLAELAARRYAHQRVALRAARHLADRPPPAWAFLPIKLDVHSATDIRSLARPKAKAQVRATTRTKTRTPQRRTR